MISMQGHRLSFDKLTCQMEEQYPDKNNNKPINPKERHMLIQNLSRDIKDD